MWLFTPFGFFSVVRDETGRKLMIRTRTRSDLDRLRKHYLPSLSPAQDSSFTDYPHRAFVSPSAFGAALREISQDIDYPNFKDEVERVLGKARMLQCHDVWAAMKTLPLAPVGLLSSDESRARRIRKFPLSSAQRKALREPPVEKEFPFVTRFDHKGLKAPGPMFRVELDRKLTPVEWARFSLGRAPWSGDDGWFIFQEGSRLFIHRRWKGTCMYIVHLKARKDGFYVIGAEIHRDKVGGTPDAVTVEKKVAQMCRVVEEQCLDVHRPDDEESDARVASEWGFRPEPRSGRTRIQRSVKIRLFKKRRP